MGRDKALWNMLSLGKLGSYRVNQREEVMAKDACHTLLASLTTCMDLCSHIMSIYVSHAHTHTLRENNEKPFYLLHSLASQCIPNMH